MREFGSFEAKSKLAELLDAVEQREEIMITHRGKPIAKLMRPDARGDATIRQLIDDGRK